MLGERLLSEASRRRYHKPKYPGKESCIEPVPYLKLPFRKSDISHNQIRKSQIGIGRSEKYSVSEGWFYSKDVRKYFSFGHSAIDFALPYDFPVAAPCEGYAISSYYSYPILDRKGYIKMKNGIRLRFGMGYFVQIYNPPQDRFVQLGHLSNIADSIPFNIPVREGNKWIATGHILNKEEMLPGKSRITYVRSGDPIGFVGYSGLADEEDHVKGFERPRVIDRNKVPTWSIPHIHMDEFQRNMVDGSKAWRRDPYDIYKRRDRYPTHNNMEDIGREPLFLTDQNDRPLFADQ